MNGANAEKVRGLISLCAGCRACERVCPSHAHGGCDPYLVMQGSDGNVAACIGCGKCSEACPFTDPKTVMLHMKAELLGLPVPGRFLECGHVTGPPDPEMSEGLPEPPAGDDVLIMPGCIVKGRLPFLLYASVAALRAVGVGSRELPGNTCCMYPIPLRSYTDAERDAFKFRMRGRAGGRDTVTLCAGCSAEMALSGVWFPHLSQYLARHLDGIRRLPGVDMKVAVEPGCSAEHMAAEVRAVVEATGAVIVNRSTGCCGKKIPGVRTELMREREAECSGAEAVVLCCPNCGIFYDSYPSGVPYLHISELICLAAGDSVTQRFHRLKLSRIPGPRRPPVVRSRLRRREHKRRCVRISVRRDPLDRGVQGGPR